MRKGKAEISRHEMTVMSITLRRTCMWHTTKKNKSESRELFCYTKRKIFPSHPGENRRRDENSVIKLSHARNVFRAKSTCEIVYAFYSIHAGGLFMGISVFYLSFALEIGKLISLLWCQFVRSLRVLLVHLLGFKLNLVL